MRDIRDIMGMPVEVRIVGGTRSSIDAVFSYFTAVDERFSTYKPDSEISKINRGLLAKENASEAMQEVFALSEKTKLETRGYFSIERPDGKIDPSGLVKGWAIHNAAQLIGMMGYADYFLNVGGDIQSRGADENGDPWTVGIRNPFNKNEIIKVIKPRGCGVATSGTYIRGDHIYNPHNPQDMLRDIVSMTVIGPNVYEADRFATAAFAMGEDGIGFIEGLKGCEGYMIDKKGIATMSSHFEQFIA